MAKQEHLKILNRGVEVWNQWRKDHPETKPDLIEAYLRGAALSRAHLRMAYLSSADLSGAHLSEADLWMAYLSGADLSGAYLIEAYLRGADLSGAHLSRADLSGANLSRADLSGANLSRADLSRANLSGANLSGANLSGANLSESILVHTDLRRANLTSCRVYGLSAWDLNLQDALQTDLVITPQDQPAVTVDNLEVAQFIYLLLSNQKLRDVIGTITSKVVLILGRFSVKQKPVLDAIRVALRQRNYLPILFDFEPSPNRDVAETVSTLAHWARFIIVDITDPRSVPQELESIVPKLPSVPIQPLLRGSSTKYGMFEHFEKYPWVLEIHRYKGKRDLLESLGDTISRIEAKRDDLLK